MPKVDPATSSIATGDAPPLLRLDGLGLVYGAGKGSLFSGLSLQVDVGQAIVLSGASGVGKTTLLRSIAGLEAQATGALYWRGSPITASEVPAFRQQAIYVAQSPPRMPMSVEESLRAAFSFRHQRQEYQRDQVLRLCQELHLSEPLLTQRLADLSGGEAQRFGLIRALLLNPQLLLLDEPASSLDAKARHALATVLATWFGQEDRSLIICCHERNWCQSLVTTHWTLVEGGELESRAQGA